MALGSGPGPETAGAAQATAALQGYEGARWPKMTSPKNRYLANGHNYQSLHLPLYLPGNGGLLTAVAMMAAGWGGCPERSTPGFPANAKWQVRWEGLKPLL